MLIHVCVLLSLASPQGEVHGRDGRIVLPRPDAPENQQPEGDQTARDAMQELFHKEVLQLRRSLFLPQSKEDAILQKIGERFDRIPERCLQLVRTADADLAYGIMRVLDVYGQPEHARELEFLLLTRSFGSATEAMVETMARIARDQARERLFSCLVASRPAVRRYAEKCLDGRLLPQDTDRLISLTRESDPDVRVKALRLLGAVPGTQSVVDRLVQALNEGPLPAEAACRALQRLGDPAVPALQDILSRPALGRSYGYAALALVGIEESRSADLFTDDMLESLILELEMPDRFQRSAVALALAGMAWRSKDVTGERYRDREIVDALVEVVAPTAPIAHLSLLQEYGLRRLMLFVGQDFGASTRLWRGWWENTRGETRFVGARRRVEVNLDNAALAELVWTTPAGRTVLCGERVAVSAPEPGSFTYLVAPEELVALVDDLRRLGFMESARLHRGPADARVLRLSVGGAATRSDPHLVPALLDRFGARVESAVKDQYWQLYRDPEREPDFAAFWRSERRWLTQHADDPDARHDRLKDRIVAALPRIPAERRALALEHLAGIPDLQTRLTEADGLAIADAARRSAEWDDVTIRLLELALLAPGERVWTELVTVADERDAEQGGREALTRIFGLIGPDRILASMRSGSPRVRQVAMEEVARLRDLRAVDPLLEIARDREEMLDLRRTAIYALGQLGAVEAREPLIAMLDGEDVEPRLQRTTWVALGRIGGDEVFAVLQKAFPSPEDADRRAIVQALGEMSHPRAARELSDIYVLRGDDALGLLALEQLRKQGDLLASPALIPHLGHPNVQIRRQIARLLGEFQHPAALPELMSMLAEDSDRLRVVTLLAGITGQDVTGRNDRIEYLRAWYAQNRSRSQGEWLLSALDDLGVRHSLRAEQLGPEVGTAVVPELTTLVLEAQQPWIRSLAARMLRVCTNRDFGTVSPLTPEAARLALCERYRALFEQDKAASGR